LGIVDDRTCEWPVLVLQAFAVERRAARRAAEQEAAARMSPAAHARSPTRWKPNIE
jgi:hypothetical protein